MHAEPVGMAHGSTPCFSRERDNRRYTVESGLRPKGGAHRAPRAVSPCCSEIALQRADISGAAAPSSLRQSAATRKRRLPDDDHGRSNQQTHQHKRDALRHRLLGEVCQNGNSEYIANCRPP